MKTELAYPHYPGYVQPSFNRGLTYQQIENVLSDPRVIECVTGLLSEVLKHPLVPADTKFNQDYYDTVIKALERVGYIRLAITLAATLITGRSVNELLWGDVEGQLVPTKFLPRPGDSLLYKWDNPRDGYYPLVWARGSEYRTDQYPRQFIIAHYWAIPNDDPYGNGLAEPLYPLVQARGRALEDWVKYSSTYAEPTRIGHFPVNAPDGEIEQFNGFINMLGSARAVTLPEGYTVDYINPPSNGTNSQKELYDSVTQDISLLIQGEGTAGRQHVGGTATQDEVSQDLRGSRAYLLGSLISDCISNTIAKWIGELNYPSEPPLVLTYVQNKTPSTTLEATKQDELSV